MPGGVAMRINETGGRDGPKQTEPRTHAGESTDTGPGQPIGGSPQRTGNGDLEVQLAALRQMLGLLRIMKEGQ